MADRISSSNRADTADCNSSSSLSLSVGYYPGEDTFSHENPSSHEDEAAKGPSIHPVPPFPGAWQTEHTGRLSDRQDQMQVDPEQFCKFSNPLAWDTEMSSNHSDSIIGWNLHGDNQWINKCPKEKTQLTLSKLNGLVQKLEQFLENQKDDKDDESVFPKSAIKEDFHLFRSTSLDMAQTVTQAIGSQRTNTTLISLSDQLEEEDTHSSTEALSCLNFRCKRIQPQESIELKHPASPDFKTF